MGQFAGASLCAFAERGLLYHRRTPPSQRLDSKTGQLDVASDWFRNEYATVMRHYGWTVAELQDGQTKIYDALRGWQPNEYEEGVYIEVKDQLISHLSTLMKDLYDHWGNDLVEKECMEHAVDLAVHALVFVT